MKNIHILPTDKPSRVYTVNSINKLNWSEGYLHQVDGTTNQNIYITSDEEIKEGDWCIDVIHNTICKRNSDNYRKQYKKIILTTDPDLIKDGIQSIPDEFLEWFVKNPSCEYVDLIGLRKEKGYEFLGYEIILPKQEQKQHIIDIMKSDEELGLYEQTKCYCGHTTYCDCGPLEEPKQTVEEYEQQGLEKYSYELKQETLEEIIGKKATDYCEQYKGTDKYNVAMLAIEFGYQLAKEEPKLTTEFQEVIDFNDKIYNKETLEEAAERLVKETTLYGSQEASIGSSARSYFETELRCVLLGMKWQQERMYSEEEVRELFNQYKEEFSIYRNLQILNVQFEEWFEQFKKNKL